MGTSANRKGGERYSVEGAGAGVSGELAARRRVRGLGAEPEVAVVLRKALIFALMRSSWRLRARLISF